MSEKAKKALELFNSELNCSQAVLGAFCAQDGAERDLALKLAAGFGGGLRSGEVCGAVSGAVMAIGTKIGHYRTDDALTKTKCYEVTSQFMEEYQKRMGTVLCRELLGYDVRDPETKDELKNRQKDICPKAIEAAVLLLEEMGF